VKFKNDIKALDAIQINQTKFVDKFDEKNPTLNSNKFLLSSSEIRIHNSKFLLA